LRDAVVAMTPILATAARENADVAVKTRGATWVASAIVVVFRYALVEVMVFISVVWRRVRGKRSWGPRARNAATSCFAVPLVSYVIIPFLLYCISFRFARR